MAQCLGLLWFGKARSATDLRACGRDAAAEGVLPRLAEVHVHDIFAASLRGARPVSSHGATMMEDAQPIAPCLAGGRTLQGILQTL